MKKKFPVVIRLPLWTFACMLLHHVFFSSPPAGIGTRLTHASLGLTLLLLGANPAAVIWNMPGNLSEKERIKSLLIAPNWFRALVALSWLLFVAGVILEFRS